MILIWLAFEPSAKRFYFAFSIAHLTAIAFAIREYAWFYEGEKAAEEEEKFVGA